MDHKTHTLFDGADANLAKLITELSQQDPATLAKKPAPNAWSVLEVMEHLRLAESFAMAYIKKKLSFNPTLPASNWQSRLRSFLLDLTLRLPIKRKAPKGVNVDNIKLDKDFATLAKEWQDQRTELRAFLMELPSELYSKQVYKHPFGGRMSLAGMLSFYNTHFDRHSKQIQRTLAKVT